MNIARTYYTHVLTSEPIDVVEVGRFKSFKWAIFRARLNAWKRDIFSHDRHDAEYGVWWSVYKEIKQGAL